MFFFTNSLGWYKFKKIKLDILFPRKWAKLILIYNRENKIPMFFFKILKNYEVAVGKKNTSRGVLIDWLVLLFFLLKWWKSDNTPDSGFFKK